MAGAHSILHGNGHTTSLPVDEREAIPSCVVFGQPVPPPPLPRPTPPPGVCHVCWRWSGGEVLKPVYVKRLALCVRHHDLWHTGQPYDRPLRPRKRHLPPLAPRIAPPSPPGAVDSTNAEKDPNQEAARL